MYIYKVELMPGYKATSDSDTSGKYHIRRHSVNTSAKDKKHRDIIRTNLDYDEAVAQAKRFNDQDGASRKVQESERESKNEDRIKEPTEGIPLFLEGSPDGQKGNAQDEKDSAGE